MRVDSARHTVRNFDVELGDNVLCDRIQLNRSITEIGIERTLVHAGLADITNRRRLDHVTDSEALDGLVLGHASRAVRAADEVNVAAALLVAAAIP